MAQKKAAGSTSLGRDSVAKRLGVKKFDGEYVKPGNIIVRQRGSSIRPGKNVKVGADDTIYAAIGGRVKFISRKIRRFTGKLKPVKIVNVQPEK
jgi:large subunit ribosomal protein L27